MDEQDQLGQVLHMVNYLLMLMQVQVVHQTLKHLLGTLKQEWQLTKLMLMQT